MKEAPPPPAKPARQQEILLYNELLECLEEEWQALINSQEEAILALSSRKEQILIKIAALSPGQEISPPDGQEGETLSRLKCQVALTQTRNYRLIAAALETIQDFWGLIKSASPGVYQAAGAMEAPPGSSFFHREA